MTKKCVRAINKFKKQAKSRLNKQRKQIVSSGRGEMGYKPQHKKGCGLAMLITGLIMMGVPGIIWYYIS